MVSLLISLALLILFYMALYIQLHVQFNSRPGTAFPVAGLPIPARVAPADAQEREFTGNVCIYCRGLLQKRFETKEHLIPLSWGGNNTPYNLRFACSSCNNHRANKPLVLWIEEMKNQRRIGCGKTAYKRFGIKIFQAGQMLRYLRANLDKVYIDDWNKQQNNLL